MSVLYEYVKWHVQDKFRSPVAIFSTYIAGIVGIYVVCALFGQWAFSLNIQTSWVQRWIGVPLLAALTLIVGASIIFGACCLVAVLWEKAENVADAARYKREGKS